MMRASIVAGTQAGRESMPFAAVADWLVEQLRPLLPNEYAPYRTGLYLATPDAGAEASVAFWSEVRAEGAAFANPRDFPWTLASSPAGHAAMALDLRGPNYTLVGADAAARAALHHALADLAADRIDHALVVVLDTTRGAHLGALLLTRGAP
ncbi:MAG: beta-ketoacyl synthase N-terminal-like domain-containing protein [Ardenticatenaceae bacterium]